MATRKQTYIQHAYTCAKQCSHASVGLAQAHLNYCCNVVLQQYHV